MLVEKLFKSSKKEEPCSQHVKDLEKEFKQIIFYRLFQYLSLKDPIYSNDKIIVWNNEFITKEAFSELEQALSQSSTDWSKSIWSEIIRTYSDYHYNPILLICATKKITTL